MPCTWKEGQACCHIFKTYCGAFGYHWELCTDCSWWRDDPEDTAFKQKMKAFYDRCHRQDINSQGRLML